MTLVLAASIDGTPETATVTNGWAQQFYRTQCAHYVTYSQDVVRARNRVAQHVIDHFPSATHILWWDTDTVVSNHAGVIEYMLGTKCDVIGAAYPRKRKPRSEVGVALGTEDIDRLQIMRAIGFGFTITSVDALRQLGAHSDTLTYTDKHEDGRRIKTKDLFGLAYVDVENDVLGCRADGESELVSEDYSFCARWRISCDGTVWMYHPPGFPVKHVGDHAY